MPKLGTKIAYLGLFGLELKKKNYCHIWNQYPRISLQ